MKVSSVWTNRNLSSVTNQIQQAAITGMAQTPFNRRKDGSSFRDWAHTAFQEALVQSTLKHADIQALFVASESDFFTLQLNPASILATDNGLHGAATTRVEGGGASGQLAVHAAVRAIQSGAYQHWQSSGLIHPPHNSQPMRCEPCTVIHLMHGTMV